MSDRCAVCNKSPAELDEPCDICGQDVILPEDSHYVPLNFHISSDDSVPERSEDFYEEFDDGC